ncbi:Uncharacterised protein [Hungatella hathewayi]|uniref:Heavy-metal-associated domain-containing protein n=1 Tax=Hungatella hathewayi TaxID=154046 RepID=A0A174KVC6_9FIRM|nr:Uncharacterised protein [Hungatella hathewayi]
MYSLSDPSKAQRIVGEIGKMDGVKKVDISEDLREMAIDADAAEFSTVMDRVVNICNKVSYGCEVKYKFS